MVVSVWLVTSCNGSQLNWSLHSVTILTEVATCMWIPLRSPQARSPHACGDPLYSSPYARSFQEVITCMWWLHCYGSPYACGDLLPYTVVHCSPGLSLRVNESLEAHLGHCLTLCMGHNKVTTGMASSNCFPSKKYEAFFGSSLQFE